VNDTQTTASMPIGRHEARTAPQAPNGHHPYPTTPSAPQAGDSHAPVPPHEQPQPQPQSAAPAEPTQPGPLGQVWQASRTDRALRKERGAGRWWAMRWMHEQPTSVADHLDYYLAQRQERPDGRRGWGLTTAIPLINGVHAGFYIVYGLLVGLPVTLACYALAWLCQRPGRAFLLAIASVVVLTNLATWLAGP
jgi:hypothetical protein